MSVLDARSRPKAEVVWATNTLNGNPICAAAGLAALGRALAARRLRQPAPHRRDGCARAWSRPGQRHGFAVQAPGEDAVFGVRFTERKPLRTWMDLTTATRTSACAGRIELLKRGLLVNPNEKFYISIAHTDADVDRTLEIADEAFAALKKGG